MRIISIASLLALALGCTKAEQTCQELAKQQCRFAYRCCNAVERNRLVLAGQGLVFHDDEASCVEELTPFLCSFFNTFADGERAGRVSPNNEAIEGCLGELRTAADTCDARAFTAASSFFEGACELTALFEGQVEDGETCFDNGECADEGAICEPKEPPDEDTTLITAKGTCRAPPGEGEECPGARGRCPWR